jgi:hypothetical protein
MVMAMTMVLLVEVTATTYHVFAAAPASTAPIGHAIASAVIILLLLVVFVIATVATVIVLMIVIVVIVVLEVLFTALVMSPSMR